MLVLHKSSRLAARMPRADYLAMDFKIKALFVYCLAKELGETKKNKRGAISISEE